MVSGDFNSDNGTGDSFGTESLQFVVRVSVCRLFTASVVSLDQGFGDEDLWYQVRVSEDGSEERSGKVSYNSRFYPIRPGLRPVLGTTFPSYVFM